MVKKIIEHSLKNAVDYTNYRKTIKQLIKDEKSTGNNQSDSLLNYSFLNDKRMDRLDKTIKLSEETIESIQYLNKKYTFLVISEGWCGDAAQITPVFNKIAQVSENISLKTVFRDENEALMDLFLTNGSRSIPKLILLDENNEVVNTWGPRPSIATKLVSDYKDQHGKLDAEFKKNLQIWYNKDKGQTTQKDIVELLKVS